MLYDSQRVTISSAHGIIFHFSPTEKDLEESFLSYALPFVHCGDEENMVEHIPYLIACFGENSVYYNLWYVQS